MLISKPALRSAAFVASVLALASSACAIAGQAPENESAALAFSGPPAAGIASDTGGWWLLRYGPVDPAKDARAARAQVVFDRMSAAADKRSNRLPELVIVGAAEDPYAVALPDGSVVLTRGALDFCYGPPGGGGGAAAEHGDLRLAFVLGHELAHLAGDDFWHSSAFAAAQRFPATEVRSPEMRSLVRPEPRDLQLAELKADSVGAITMAMADYSVRDLFRADPDFFASWVAQTGLEAAYDDPRHPGPETRTEFLRTELAAVIEELDLFHFGVRLAELRRYGDAILLLERFGDRFAGREVLSNLGYAHYQVAVKLLAACDGAPVVRFRLPVAIDDETLANRVRLRGGDSTCLAAEPVRKRLAEARRYLELAVAKDPRYLPARRNLLALEIVSGKAAAAFALAEDTLALQPGDAATLTAQGVGLYLLGVDSNWVETVDRALAVLKEAEADPRRAADAVFNQAVILAERGRTAAARGAWVRFLQLEPHGAHADLARERLGQPPMPAPPPAPAGLSPIPLGEVNPATRVALGAMQSHPFEIGDLRLRVYRGPGISALQLGEAIEVVEQASAAPAPGPALPGGGPPVRVESRRGVLLRYAGHALDVDTENDRLRAIVYFVPAR